MDLFGMEGRDQVFVSLLFVWSFQVYWHFDDLIRACGEYDLLTVRGESQGSDLLNVNVFEDHLGDSVTVT